MRISCPAIVFLALFIPSQADAATIDFAHSSVVLTDLGARVNPTAINNHGVIVGQGSNGQAFRWENGTAVSLGTLGGSQSYANDINDDGIIVGWSLDGSAKMKAFRYDTVITNIEGTATLQSSAEAINGNGAIVGWKTNGTTITRSALWDDANATGLILFSSSGNAHKALGVNDAGEIVGIDFSASPQGFYYDGVSSGVTFTSGLPTDYLPLAGINNHSLTAGRELSEANIFQLGNLASQTLGKLSPSDSSSLANGFNDENLIVGESGVRGFVYDLSTSTLYDINQFTRSGFSVDSVLRLTDVNDNGTFVGVATIGGIEHGVRGDFVAVPEPSALFMIAAAAGSLIVSFVVPAISSMARQRYRMSYLARRTG